MGQHRQDGDTADLAHADLLLTDRERTMRFLWVTVELEGWWGVAGARAPMVADRVDHAANWRPVGDRHGAGNGIRTRDFDLGKVALYH